MNPEVHPYPALGENGLFAIRWPEFEYRPAQQKMSSLIWERCQEGGYALIEAGTGTGKSLAYLYPVFLAVQENQFPTLPVIISTYTINLQQQLIEKEIPFLNQTLGSSRQTALLLGRGNYLCWRKLHFFRQNLSLLEPAYRNCFERVWRSASQQVGSVEQLGYALPFLLREKITSESATCLRKYCSYQNSCFWVAARKKAFSAEVVIVNHHLFFTDLAMRRQGGFSDEGLVLPPYQFVIFDEAHHLAEVAGEHLGMGIDQNEINHFCHRLLQQDGKWGRGWLPSLRQRLVGNLTDLAQLQTAIQLLEQSLIPGLLELENLFHAFFQALDHHQLFRPTRFRANESKQRFTADLLTDPYLSKVVNQLRQALDEWVSQLSRFVDGLEEVEALREDFVFLAEAGHFFTGISASLPLLLDGSDDQFVSWLTIRPDSRGQTVRTMLNRVPLQLGDLLHRQLFTQVKGGVLTSATLTVKGDFSYIKERLGLDLSPSETCREGIFASPFNYQANVSVIIARDLPPPEDPSYLAAVSTLLPRIIQAAGGRTLLLFTNKQHMNEVYAKIIPPLTKAGIHPLRQGDEPRHRLLRKFQTVTPSALLGMDSFWEGVDIPGPELSNVIIMRLPFRVPTEPIFQARWEAVSKEGKDPFLNLSLPEAVIKFKQGFGRLIRSQSDRGVVVILDPRIYTKRYGQVFLSSIPGGQITVATQDELPVLIGEWLV
ncbi:MAG TPA: hypothetical protein DD789_03810 [Firmicutes bacterium]|jgi:ATP-dependent DNA helicase DinG|nr:hypothetical protein [Bacillota bacterium]